MLLITFIFYVQGWSFSSFFLILVFPRIPFTIRPLFHDSDMSCQKSLKTIQFRKTKNRSHHGGRLTPSSRSPHTQSTTPASAVPPQTPTGNPVLFFTVDAKAVNDTSSSPRCVGDYGHPENSARARGVTPGRVLGSDDDRAS